MKRQRSILVEITAILLVTITGSVWVWNHTSLPEPSSDDSDKSSFEEAVIVEVKTDTLSYSHLRVPTVNEKWQGGKNLFKSNCAACHNPKVNQTGPALMGVTKRWQDAGEYKGISGKQWLTKWIRDCDVVLKERYPYAVALKNQWKTDMTRFPLLSDGDIEKILYYVEMPSDGVTIVAY